MDDEPSIEVLRHDRAQGAVGTGPKFESPFTKTVLEVDSWPPFRVKNRTLLRPPYPGSYTHNANAPEDKLTTLYSGIHAADRVHHVDVPA